MKRRRLFPFFDWQRNGNENDMIVRKDHGWQSDMIVRRDHGWQSDRMEMEEMDMTCREAQNLVTDYINRELGGRQLEKFLKHVRGCEECYKELEIYYMIHFAMQKLDLEEQVSYDVKRMLEEDLRDAEKLVFRWKMKRCYRYIIMILAEMILCFVIFTQIQNFSFGGIEETFFYHFFF